MSGVTNIYSQAQENIYTNNLGKANQKEEGQFKALNISATQDVDPSTKDDECASVFKAEKDANKAQKTKSKEDNKNRLNALQKIKENQNINEQDQRSHRISKATEKMLESIGKFVSKNLSETIQERSQKLFDGSEKAYEECFEALKKAIASEEIAKAIGRFKDVPEQHNALQIYIQVRERELAELKKLLQNLPSEKELGAQTKQQDQELLQKQIQELEKALNNIKKAQGDLMARHGARIEDSYKLAPLLREVSAFYPNGTPLPPKTLCALILDQILPLKGDAEKTFACLMQGLGLNLSNGANIDIERFKHNLKIIASCLTQELQSCPNTAIAAAILNTLRNLQKIDTIQKLNAGLIALLAEILYFKDKKSKLKDKSADKSEKKKTDNFEDEKSNKADKKSDNTKNKNTNFLDTTS